MGKKLIALALVGTAAYLFKTKHGQELRKTLGENAGKLGKQLQDLYATAKDGSAKVAKQATA
jgi:hypothetical protein